MIDMINKVLNLLSILWLPLWHVQRLIPRNRSLWVFGAWYGEKYSDNARVLFEYVNLNQPDIEAIWLTKNDKVYKKLKERGIKVELSNSFKAIFYSLRAGVVFYSSGKGDVNNYFINGALLVNLWHGAPLKRIGLDDNFSSSQQKNLILKYLLPFKYEYDIDYILNSSDIFIDKMSSAFNVKKNNVITTGFPRNDLFWSADSDDILTTINAKFNKPFKILYLPTFRSISQKFKPFEKYSFDKDVWNDFLCENNMVFISKGHFVDGSVGDNNKSDRIIHLSDESLDELYVMLKDIDILITDYSSVFFDFLLTNKPIIFAPFDMDEYLGNSRKFYFNYEEVICGPIAFNWGDVMKSILQIIEKDNYMLERKTKALLFNKYLDSNSSMRLCDKIKEITK